MPTISEVFGNDLQPDPSVALPPIQIPIRRRTGPSPRLQFVIEFVGPRSVSAGSAAVLLSADWEKALGSPQAFAMSTADLEWQPLTASTAGSYDSLALAWDLTTIRGQLSAQTARHLLATAERFAEQIQRKAMPMPVPEDVPKALTQLKKVSDNFDAGASILALPKSQEVGEFELWIWCAKLGLTSNLTEGTFDWLVPGSPLPLFSVSPVGDTDSFSIEGAQRGDKHEGALLGFSIPRSPEPMAGLEGMFKAAAYLAERMWGTIYDENNRPLDDRGRQTIRTQLADAVEAMTKMGFAPGSTDALRLFGDR